MMATEAPEVRPRGSSIDEMEELLGEADLRLLPCGDLAEGLYSDPPSLDSVDVGPQAQDGAARRCVQLAPKTALEHGFMEGERVQTQWTVEEGGDDAWWPATVVKVLKDGKCELKYDDGDSWTGDARYIVRLTLAAEAVPMPAPRDWKRKQPAESCCRVASHAGKLPRMVAAEPAVHATGVQQVLDPDEQALLSELAGVFGSTDTKETLRMALAMMRGQPRDCGAGGVMAAPSLCKCSSAAVLCRCPVPMSVEEPKLSTPPDSLNGTPEPDPSSPSGPADTRVPAPASGSTGPIVEDLNLFRYESEKSSTLARVGAKALDYSRFMDCHGFGVALMDMQGNFLWTNSTIQGLLGYSGEQLSSLSMMHMTPAEDLPGMMAMMPRLMEPGSQPTITSPMVSKPSGSDRVCCW